MEDNSALAFIYCDHARREEQTATHLLGALLGQIINRLSSEDDIIKDLLQRQREGRLLDLTSAVQYMHRLSSAGLFSCIRLCADGLDELLKTNRAVFLHALASLAQIAHVRCLFFGRSNAGIQDEIESFFATNLPETTMCIALAITGDMTAEDRSLFARQSLAKSTDWRALDEDTKIQIVTRLSFSGSTYENILFR
jgi:hypothetical protein